MRAFVPSLTVQPLLENAIYHGIEPLPGGGTVTISGHARDGEVRITVTNPVAEPSPGTDMRAGNRIALENIRQRLRFAYPDRGALEIERRPGEYQVTLRFPLQE
jgi:two-component system sensor histidine kinase AlgZ